MKSSLVDNTNVNYFAYGIDFWKDHEEYVMEHFSIQTFIRRIESRWIHIRKFDISLLMILSASLLPRKPF